MITLRYQACFHPEKHSVFSLGFQKSFTRSARIILKRAGKSGIRRVSFSLQIIPDLSDTMKIRIRRSSDIAYIRYRSEVTQTHYLMLDYIIS